MRITRAVRARHCRLTTLAVIRIAMYMIGMGVDESHPNDALLGSYPAPN